MNSSAKSIFSFAARFSIGTFLSRVSGLLRDITMAFLFGTSPAVASFFVAYRFASLMRRLFGESPLSGSFIPHFEEARHEKPKEGAKFFIEFFFSLALILLAAVAVVEGALLLIGGHVSESTREILSLTMIMLPGLFFICFYGLTSSLLQCESSYFIPSAAPILFNGVWIAGALFACTQPKPLYLLSCSIILGFFCQWAFVLPRAYRYLKSWLSLKEMLAFKPFSKRVRAVFAPFFLGILGVTASQINSAVDVIFSRVASLEGPAYLWYAVRIYQLPIAFVGVAIASALLPSLSQELKRENGNQFLSLLRLSFTRAFFFALPATALFFLLGKLLIECLFAYGGFGSQSVDQTTLCLWGYSVGLVPSIFCLIYVTAFQAQKKYWVPTAASIFSVIVNVLLNVLFICVLHYKTYSVSLATSLSSLLQCAVLHFFFVKKIGAPFLRPEWVKGIKIGVSTLAAVFAVFFINFYVPFLSANRFTFFYKCVALTAQGGTFLAAFCGVGMLLKIEEMKSLLQK